MSINPNKFAKLIVYLMMLAVVVICGVLLPELAREESVGKPDHPSALPFLLIAWAIATPVFIALQQTLKLLKNLDQNNGFSTKSVSALSNIKICAYVFNALLLLTVLFVTITTKSVDPLEDITPLFTFSCIFIFVSTTISVFVSVLKKLLQNVIDMKSENDLTV